MRINAKCFFSRLSRTCSIHISHNKKKYFFSFVHYTYVYIRSKQAAAVTLVKSVYECTAAIFGTEHILKFYFLHFWSDEKKNYIYQTPQRDKKKQKNYYFIIFIPHMKYELIDSLLSIVLFYVQVRDDFFPLFILMVDDYHTN